MTARRWITNYDSIATNDQRIRALDILEAGLNAIDTEQIILQNVHLEGTRLTIKDHEAIDIGKFKRVRVIGFGKAACQAAAVLERVLGSMLDGGVVIGLEPTVCNIIETYQGTHPKPSAQNLSASKKIYDLAKDSDEHDLVLVIVSGGGSSFLCWPEEECLQGERLYKEFVKVGGTIRELNTVRKHLSQLKGGGLAKLLYPATVVGLIFSDVPGNQYDMVSSGPTYKDLSTISDAQEIIERHSLGQFDLTETPKEDKYFEKVTNIILVSNELALSAMHDRAKELGLHAHIVSSEIYDTAPIALERLRQFIAPATVSLGGGEISMRVTPDMHQRSGRNLYLAQEALSTLQDGELFISAASDGMDNGEAMGAIVDSATKEKHSTCTNQHSGDPFEFFECTGDLIFSGSTHANVSDLMLLLKK